MRKTIYIDFNKFNKKTKILVANEGEQVYTLKYKKR